MPIYEYRCRGCGNEFEQYVHSASSGVACPTCASALVNRKLSVFGLRTGGPEVSTVPSGGGGCCGGGCGCH